MKHRIGSIAKGDADRAMHVLMLAFAGDPFVRWCNPEAQGYLTHFPTGFRAMAGKAFDEGSAYGTEDFAGVAIWLPPVVEGDSDENIETAVSAIPEDRRDAVSEISGLLADYHPKDAAYWYLPLIGVDPVHRGAGHGSALMEHALRKCDEAETQAFLESSNPRNITLFERHGFEVMGRIEKGGSPPVYPMLRRAR